MIIHQIINKNFFKTLFSLLFIVCFLYFIKNIDINVFINLINNAKLKELFILSYLICIIQFYFSILKFNFFFKNKKSLNISNIFFISSFFNFIIPFKGGELYKYNELKKINYFKNKNIVEFIIFDKISEISLFFILFITLFFNLNYFDSIFLNYLILLVILFTTLFTLIRSDIIKSNFLSKYFKLFVEFYINGKLLICNIIIISLSLVHFIIFLYSFDLLKFDIYHSTFILSYISIISSIPISFNGVGARETALLILNIFTLEEIVLIGIFFLSRGMPSALVGLIMSIKNFLKFKY